MKLTAKALRATLVIDPGELYSAQVPPGMPRVSVEIAASGRNLRAELNAKSLRRVIAAVEAGEVAVIIQGKLEVGDVLAEAGISALPKAKKE